MSSGPSYLLFVSDMGNLSNFIVSSQLPGVYIYQSQSPRRFLGSNMQPVLAEHVQPVHLGHPATHIHHDVVPQALPPRTLSGEKLSGLADQSGRGQCAKALSESKGVRSDTFGGEPRVFRAISRYERFRSCPGGLSSLSETSTPKGCSGCNASD